jgi:hypothetical protein
MMMWFGIIYIIFLIEKITPVHDIQSKGEDSHRCLVLLSIVVISSHYLLVSVTFLNSLIRLRKIAGTVTWFL